MSMEVQGILGADIVNQLRSRIVDIIQDTAPAGAGAGASSSNAGTAPAGAGASSSAGMEQLD